MKRITLLLTVLLLLLASCGQPAESTPQAAETTATSEVTGVTIIYEDPAQVELITLTGRHIYIDVSNVALLSREPTSEDILLTTHKHSDHYYAAFVDAFPGQQLFTSTGKIELPDVTITGIASAHNTNDVIQDVGATNYIYIIETDGLRIVHFGDLGQEALTDDQLAVIGPVDLSITQFANSFSSMDATNLKGFKLMDQVQPRLILPTHSDSATIKVAAARWPGYYSESRIVTLSPENIPTETSFLILGNLATAYATLYNLKLWK